MAPMRPPSWPQGDMPHPTPLPSPCHESLGRPQKDEERSDSDVPSGVREDEDYAGISVAHHVKAVTQVFEQGGVIPGAETPSSEGCLWPHPSIFQRISGELIDAEYTLVRVALEGHGTVNLDEMTQDLDENVGNILQVPSISPLNDGSLEILVRNAYLPNLQRKIHERPIRLTLDSGYCPLKPLLKDVEYWGFEKARELYALWFLERGIRIVQKSWAIAQMYYRYALRHHHQKIRTLLSGMETMGNVEDSMLDCLQTERREEDVRRLLRLIRRRLSTFQTGQSLRQLFRLGDMQALSLFESSPRTSIVVD